MTTLMRQTFQPSILLDSTADLRYKGHLLQQRLVVADQVHAVITRREVFLWVTGCAARPLT